MLAAFAAAPSIALAPGARCHDCGERPRPAVGDPGLYCPCCWMRTARP